MATTHVVTTQPKTDGVPVGGLVAMPSTTANLDETNYPVTLLRTGVVALSRDYPLAPLSGGTALYEDRAWSQGTMAVSTTWYALAWNGTVFCAVNRTTIAATSSDGITWTQRTLPVSGDWSSIAWNGTVFCTVADTTKAAISTDGITWTRTTMPSSATWNCIGVKSGTFFVLSYNTTNAASSADGISWTARTMPAATGWRALVWNGSVFCAISGASGSANIAATSSDGITWTQRTLPASLPWASIEWNGFIFYAVASSSAVTATSVDGITWTQMTLVSATWTSILSKASVLYAISGTITCVSPYEYGFPAPTCGEPLAEFADWPARDWPLYLRVR